MSGKNLGDYTLVKELGSSAMGTLYVAEHRFLKRSFALKILPEEIVSDPGFVDRFEKEVTSLSAIEHPHIVRVHNISCSAGKYYLVSDCILQSSGKGQNLYHYLKEHTSRMREENIYRIALQMADALDFVHSNKMGKAPLSHRALKLSNILIQEKEDGPHVYLCDFGLSRLLGAEFVFKKVCGALIELLSSDEKSTKKGARLSETAQKELEEAFFEGFYCLAPEQRRLSDSSTIDEVKADVYAFAVVVYYLHMRSFPEGAFEMPSERFADLKMDWTRLFRECLHSNPSKRPFLLRPLLEAIAVNVLAPSKLETIYDERVAPTKEGAFAFKPDIKPAEIVRPQFEPDPGAIFKTESSISRYQPKTVDTKNIDPLMTEMAIVHGGTFYRGSNSGGRDESPRHQIILKPFAIDVCPVTNEQFVRFLEVMGGEKDGNNNDMIRLRESRIKRSGGKLSIESGYSRHPVVGVTWYGAAAYAKWIGKRLPSEAEWEVASYGGLDDATYPTGSHIERTQANFFSSDTTAVMSYPANNYGLYDMAGNVYEWCSDWYDYHYYNMSVQEPDNPKGPLQGVYRVLRGGCWKSLKEDMRCSHRHRNNPGAMNGTYGFRCVADVVER
jgi:formylglycine-generating enzyme required for sulfatase activity